MATKTFGKEIKSGDQITEELYTIVGDRFPLSLTIANGAVVNMTYEDEWKEGTTNAIDTSELDENNQPIVNYEEDYTNKKLSKAQIAKINAWAEENIA